MKKLTLQLILMLSNITMYLL